MKDNFYKDIYEKLYQVGYKPRTHCGKAFLKHIIKKYKFKTALDVGCSTGDAVHALKKNKKVAIGIDVSPTAIKMAKKLKRNCLLGSACEIPFDDDEFDLVFSSDCIEHLKPEDVDKCIKELIRVSKRYIALQISTRKEKDKGKYNWIKKADLKGIANLHLSIFNSEEWEVFMNESGAEVISFKAEGKYVYIVLEKICNEENQ